MRCTPTRAARGLIVELLDLVDRAGVVVELAGVPAALQASDELPDIDEFRERFAPRTPTMPDVLVLLPSSAVYYELLEAA